MRCVACNEALTDSEATRKFSSSGAFADLCEPCFAIVCGDLAAVEAAHFVGTMDNLVEEGMDNLVVSSIPLGDLGDAVADDVDV